MGSETDGPRVVVVTGASSGIGLSVSLTVAARGDHVVLLARDEGSLKEAAQSCEDAGAGSATVLPTDVGDDDAVAGAVSAVLDLHGHIDAVASCAGVVSYGRVEDVPAAVFDGVLRTNLTGSANVARHVLPVFRRQGHGVLVLVGSVVGHLGVPTMTPYVVSKWGLRALARQLQLENRDVPGLSVSYLAPGGVRTPIYEQAANYSGWAGRPPPPVDSPEKVAGAVVRLFDHPRHRTQVGLANNVMRFGFSVLPPVYDALVGPLFGRLARDRSRPVGPVEGNVLVPHPERHRVQAREDGGTGPVSGSLARVKDVAGRVSGLLR